jgi:hypothetical protein
LFRFTRFRFVSLAFAFVSLAFAFAFLAFAFVSLAFAFAFLAFAFVSLAFAFAFLAFAFVSLAFAFAFLAFDFVSLAARGEQREYVLAVTRRRCKTIRILLLKLRWANYRFWGPRIQFWLWEADFEVINQSFVGSLSKRVQRTFILVLASA